MDRQSAYLNPMQHEVAVLNPRDAVIVAGRGTGKGRLQAIRLLNAVQAMPRSTSAFVAPNAIRALTNILPSITMHWEEWGYRRGTHWIIGRRPLYDRWGWERPLIEPMAFETVISFYNGSVVQIISQDRVGTSNSKSFDYVAVDEAKFIKFDRLKDETFQANRGQEREFGSCFLHHGMTITSDMPVTKAGSWFLAYEERMDTEVIGALIATLQERNAIQERIHTEGAAAPAYLDKQLRAIARRLDTLRRAALFFNTYSTLTNIEVLGTDYIRRMKRELPPLVFYTSILCRRIKQLRDGFYSSLRERHLYTAANFHYLDALDYQFRELTKKTCRIDADIRTDLPLCIALDFNRNINWLVVAQADEDLARMNTLKAFWVKYERKLPELVQDFCDYYDPLPRHEVVFYYDSTALGSNYAVNDEDFHRVVEQVLARNRWRCTPVYIGRPLPHGEKHLLINQGLAGQKRLTPFFNEEHCQDLLVSIRTAGVYNGKKDKRGEKLAETEEDRLESRTDGSDAWDTLYIGCQQFPQHAGLVIPTSNWA